MHLLYKNAKILDTHLIDLPPSGLELTTLGEYFNVQQRKSTSIGFDAR